MLYFQSVNLYRTLAALCTYSKVVFDPLKHNVILANMLCIFKVDMCLTPANKPNRHFYLDRIFFPSTHPYCTLIRPEPIMLA